MPYCLDYMDSPYHFFFSCFHNQDYYICNCGSVNPAVKAVGIIWIFFFICITIFPEVTKWCTSQCLQPLLHKYLSLKLSFWVFAWSSQGHNEKTQWPLSMTCRITIIFTKILLDSIYVKIIRDDYHTHNNRQGKMAKFTCRAITIMTAFCKFAIWVCRQSIKFFIQIFHCILLRNRQANISLESLSFYWRHESLFFFFYHNLNACIGHAMPIFPGWMG